MLRRVLGRYVPAALYERPKMGFEVPIGVWLREPLRDWANDVLAPNQLTASNLFNTTAVRRVLDEHVTGKTDAAHVLWNILMFEAWRQEWHASV